MILKEIPGDWRRMARGFLKMKEGGDELLERAGKLLEENIRPRYVFRVCGIGFSESGTVCAGLILPGNDIKRHLEGYESAVLMCVTLGEGAEKAVRAASASSRALGAVADAAASALAELAADEAERLILSSLGAKRSSSRFSPGYGDLPLGIQGAFLDFLKAKKRLGVGLTEGCMMLPRKTVTAVIGVEK